MPARGPVLQRTHASVTALRAQSGPRRCRRRRRSGPWANTSPSTVNGHRRELDVEPRRLLVQVLREDLDLTGTHVGCDTSQCGACTVHVDGKAVKSLHDARRPGRRRDRHDHRGHGRRRDLHPLQKAFWEKHGLQCGFCTPGMIMAAADLLARNADPTEDEIRHAIEGNICRCTGYQNIVAAIRAAAAAMRDGATAARRRSA